MLFIAFPLHFACFVSGSRSFLCCCRVADVIHYTFLAFFAISISLRFCQFLVYQFVLFLITGVLSHCYTFSLKATTLLQFSRHEKFIYSFVPSWPMLFIAFLLLLYTRNFAWYNSLSFLLCFCVWHLAYCFVIITGFFSHRFTSTLFIANFALVFPA